MSGRGRNSCKLENCIDTFVYFVPTSPDMTDLVSVVTWLENNWEGTIYRSSYYGNLAWSGKGNRDQNRETVRQRDTKPSFHLLNPVNGLP